MSSASFTACLPAWLQEAYEGPALGCDVTGLVPKSQYVFCVKALFDDASFLWSAPLLVTTAKKADVGASNSVASMGGRVGGSN